MSSLTPCSDVFTFMYCVYVCMSPYKPRGKPQFRTRENCTSWSVECALKKEKYTPHTQSGNKSKSVTKTFLKWAERAASHSLRQTRSPECKSVCVCLGLTGTTWEVEKDDALTQFSLFCSQKSTVPVFHKQIQPHFLLLLLLLLTPNFVLESFQDD